ncbi:hypothetical protein GCM10027596_40710 [Nocardioides korecus]
MTRVRTRLSRLPLRARLVAGFAAATLVTTLAAGALIYWRVSYALDRGLDSELTQADRRLTALVRPDGTVANHAQADATGVGWQILTSDGRVLDHGGPTGDNALVSVRRLHLAVTQPRVYNVGDFLPVSAQSFRVHVAAAGGTPGDLLLVGVRRDHRDEALRELLVQFSVAGLGVLLISALVGDRLSRAALRPVERYRRQAAEIAGGSGDLRLAVPANRDDEITRLGHTFNDMLASLEEALDRERHFVDDASHELRTPVTLLTSRVQLALRRPRTVAEHERILTELRVDLDRLAQLAEQLLQVGRVGLRNREDPHDKDLVATVQRVVTQRRAADPSRAGDLVVALPSDPLVVPLPEFQVERIVTNLLDNAAAHGAPPVEVTVDRAAAGWARLVVADAGDGMALELLRTVTQRFVRAEEARGRPGSGLGLSLVNALVIQAGGELRICSRGCHTSHGLDVTVPCTHDTATTMTVLLPTTVPGDDQDPGPPGPAFTKTSSTSA